MDESSFEESPTNNESFDSIPNLDIGPPEKEDGRISAQSQVLMNSDLIEFILSFMRSSDEAMKQPECTHVLWASLACKSFFEPGMNVLWRSMNSWSPMVHLIPTVEEDELDSNIFRTTEVLRKEHLQRLLEYSRRIRYFQFAPSTQPVAPQIYTSIGKHAQFELFPTLSRLEMLSLDQINMANISSLSLVLPPTLSDVTISSITPRVEILAATLLDDISEKGQKLLKLSLGGKMSILCFNTIRALNSLQTLHIFSTDSSLPGDFVKIISRLDSLKWLHISLDGSSRWSPPEDTRTVGSPNGFSSLRNLNITGSSGFVWALIGYITPLPKLATINLHFSSNTGKESGRWGERLASLTGPDLLGIRVTSTSMASPITVVGLQILFSTRLQVLQLETIRLSPGAIGALSSSKFSGAIQKIRIVATKGVQNLVANKRLHVETADLSAIRSFSNLQSLEISINLDLAEKGIKSMQQATKIARQCHTLQELVLVPYQSYTSSGDFNVKNAFIFARCINHLFPHLKKFDLSKFTAIDASWRQGTEAMVIGLQDVQKCDCHLA